MICECADGGCKCAGKCSAEALIVLYRVDMADETGTNFCAACAEDAMDSGVYTAETEDGDDTDG